MMDASSNTGSEQSPSDNRLNQLVAAAKGGSDSALGRALVACRPQLLRTARRRLAPALRPVVGASDIVQDTFVNAARAFPLFKGEKGSQFFHWLRRILSNRIAQVARTNAQPHPNGVARFSGDGTPPRLSLLAAEQETPSHIASNEEDADRIRACLARLCERDQQVLQLRIGERLGFAQIGRQMKLSEDAARMLFTRALHRLRREMHDGKRRKQGRSARQA
jgi:RNA polymerase sigma-70 factor, ECF subfamily